MPESLCDCGAPATHECVECGQKACERCAESWQGNICWYCQSDNPVFYDSHSRAPGAVDPRDGVVR
jgi:hypothetical protein